MQEVLLRQRMCEIGRLLWERNLVGATEGNISVRLDAERLLCTPSGRSKGHLCPEELVTIDLEGRPLDGRLPSSEIAMHLRCYARRPDCMAVVHAHPPVATAFALSGDPIPDDILPEAAIVLGPVALAPFAMPGTQEVPDSLEPFLMDHKTFLLSHHGAVVLGRDLDDAYFRMETLERTARTLFYARALSGPRSMPPAATAALLAAWGHGGLG